MRQRPPPETSRPPDLFHATTGRRRFLRSAGLAVAGLAWLQTPTAVPTAFAATHTGGGRIGRGYDFMTTKTAQQYIHVPATVLGEGMQEFKGTVRFSGAPLSATTGNADTIMERLEDATVGEAVPTRLVGFGNVSTQPIELKGTGTLAGKYWLYVTLSPTAQSGGHTVLFADGEAAQGGTFVSKVTLAPLFELVPATGGPSLYLDTAQIELPGFPMRLATSEGRWSSVLPDTVVRWTFGQSLYYPETVHLRTLRTREQALENPDLPLVVAACAKASATL